MRFVNALQSAGRSVVGVGFALLTFFAVPSLAAAQEQEANATQRADVLAAERDKKATEVAAPERSNVEQALYWYDNQYLFTRIMTGWKGFRLASGQFPAGAGTGVGVGFKKGLRSPSIALQQPRAEIEAIAAYTARGYTRGGAAFTVRPIAGAALDLRVSGQYYKFPQEDYFGPGQESRSEDRTNYLLESQEGSADILWKPARFVDLGFGVSYLSPRIGSGTDSRYLSTDQIFDAKTAPGLDEQPDFLRGRLSAAFDWRDNPLHPHSGGRYGVELSRYRDETLNAYDFRRIDIDLQQYVPLPNRYRTIALRAAAVITDPQSGNDVPFYFQPTLGGSRMLRGFREFRFRDRNSLMLTAEYRWEASWLLDGALFVDAGKVTGDRSDLNFRDLDVSYGFGFRVHSNSAFVTRLDLAFSREGFIPLLRFEHVF